MPTKGHDERLAHRLGAVDRRSLRAPGLTIHGRLLAPLRHGLGLIPWRLLSFSIAAFKSLHCRSDRVSGGGAV
jgi:hypothetical protein